MVLFPDGLASSKSTGLEPGSNPRYTLTRISHRRATAAVDNHDTSGALWIFPFRSMSNTAAKEKSSIAEIIMILARLATQPGEKFGLTLDQTGAS